eukprot:gb/GEZN01009720.1/.p1 GENE.gb/GEZN01009720.1/~~gb/GEZN01009720.1/.p1  ORF type:complete len:394 (-),score=23.14 gb/GEZN01009720.1/:46-1227(-)
MASIPHVLIKRRRQLFRFGICFIVVLLSVQFISFSIDNIFNPSTKIYEPEELPVLRPRALQRNKIDVVLPMIGLEWPLFIIQYHSLCANVNVTAFGNIYMVVPDCEFAELRAAVATLSCPEPSNVLNIVVLSERHGSSDRSLNIPREFTGNGWYVQQLIKLAIAQRVQTEFYLFIDADCVAVRRNTVWEDFFVRGEAGLRTPWVGDSGTKGKGCRGYMFETSARLIGLTPPDPCMSSGATPQLMSTRITLSALERLQEVHKVPWYVVLTQRHWITQLRWTEAGIYIAAALHYQTFDRFHVLDKRIVYNYDDVILEASRLDEAAINNTLDRYGRDPANAPLFHFVQSNMRLPLEFHHRIYEKLVAGLPPVSSVLYTTLRRSIFCSFRFFFFFLN